ncbi:MAG: hypothetical protein AAGK21_11190 [Bacteroidota bacterium]
MRLSILMILLAASASAQVATGDSVPLAAEPIASAGGAPLALADVAGPEGLVVAFWSDTCPWARRYADRLDALARDYGPSGIGFVRVYDRRTGANAGRLVTADSTAGGAYPVLLDDGRLAEAFGVESSPHVYFFGRDRTLLYDGAIDDSPASQDRVRVMYLSAAMDASLAALPVEIQRTQAFGCIRRQEAE